MANLRAVELKAFVPSEDYALMKRFYQNFGFDGVRLGRCRVLPSRSGQLPAAEILRGSRRKPHDAASGVEDVDAWWERLHQEGFARKYGLAAGGIELQPWQMQEFFVIDLAAVLWRIGQNV